MPFPTKKLKVFPNPWVYIDHNGRPAGRLPPDPYEDSPSARSIGATMTDVVEVQKPMVMRVAGMDLEVNPAQHEHRITYSREAVEIPNTPYYRNAIKCLDLIAADAETAAVSGVKFEDPTVVLARVKAAAIKAFDAETGQDAHKKFGSVEPLFTDPLKPVVTQTVQAPAPVAAPEPVKADK